MQVYGDHSCEATTGELVAGILAGAAALADEQPGLGWHGRCVALLIELGALLQGVADRELEARGCDEPSPNQQRLMVLLLNAARSVRLSWRSGFAEQAAPEIGEVQSLDLPPAQRRRDSAPRCSATARCGTSCCKR